MTITDEEVKEIIMNVLHRFAKDLGEKLRALNSRIDKLEHEISEVNKRIDAISTRKTGEQIPDVSILTTNIKTPHNTELPKIKPKTEVIKATTQIKAKSADEKELLDALKIIENL
ncbi:MAG: hypothetical protein ACTSW1_04540 [Candidatus Hodarchaeales archaeon]